MPRVLIAFHYTSERFGGEAAIPLQIFDGLRRRGVDAWLVAHDSDREELTSRYEGTPDRLILTPSLPAMTPVFTRGQKLPDGPRVLAWAATQIERQIAMTGVRRPAETAQRRVRKPPVVVGSAEHNRMRAAPRPGYLLPRGAIP